MGSLKIGKELASLRIPEYTFRIRILFYFLLRLVSNQLRQRRYIPEADALKTLLIVVFSTDIGFLRGLLPIL